MKQIKLIVPDNWNDITIKQYQDFTKVLESKKGEKEKTFETVCIFCKVKRSDLNNFAFADVEKIAKILLKMTSADPSGIELKRNIEFKKQNYGVIPNMSKMTTGEFVDLESYCENSTENLHKIVSILYRKQVGAIDRFSRYEIENYKPTQEKEQLMLELPMGYALGILNFFFHLGEQLLIDSVSYLETLKSNKTREHQLKEG